MTIDGHSVSPQAKRRGTWLPEGKRAAVCFTIDDIHPGKSTDAYEAGGDLGRGALGHVERLLSRHPKLHVTLFVTADWREISAVPTRKWLAKIPFARDRVMLADVLPRGTMRLDRHPAFVRYVKALPRTELALHGLHHVHPGPRIPVEFQEQDARVCERMLRDALAIFDAAGLPVVKGICPPGWDAPPGLVAAMNALDFLFVASARDIKTPIAEDARAQMSGMKGVSLLYPEVLGGGRLVHIPANFQATSPPERALEILRCGGVLSIKAHIVKKAMGFVMLDGVDELYCNYLDVLFRELERELGDSLWWTTMGEIAARVRARDGAAARVHEEAIHV